jgi:cell division protein FtsQ
MRLFRAFLAVSALVAIVIFVFTSSLFNVATVDVTGNAALTEGEIREQAGLIGSVNIFSFNTREAERALLAAPYIAGASMSKRLPNALRIDVRERRPSGYIDHKGQGVFILIDDEGVALEAPGHMARRLPVITGLAVDAFTLGHTVTAEDGFACAAVFEIARSLAPHGLDGLVTRVDVTDPNDIKLHADLLVALIGGDNGSNELNRKLDDVRSILESGTIPEGARCTIDLREAGVPPVLRFN